MYGNGTRIGGSIIARLDGAAKSGMRFCNSLSLALFWRHVKDEMAARSLTFAVPSEAIRSATRRRPARGGDEEDGLGVAGYQHEHAMYDTARRKRCPAADGTSKMQAAAAR